MSTLTDVSQNSGFGIQLGTGTPSVQDNRFPDALFSIRDPRCYQHSFSFSGTPLLSRDARTVMVLDTYGCLSSAQPVPSLDENDRVKYGILTLNFLKEKLRSGLNDKVADRVFSEVAIELCKIDFLRAEVEVTPTRAIKFMMTLYKDKLLMVSKSLSDDLNGEPDATIIFSLFINRELIATDAADIHEFVKGITRYLSV